MAKRDARRKGKTKLRYVDGSGELKATTTMPTEKNKVFRIKA